MYQNWTQSNISCHMGNMSSADKQEIFPNLVIKGTSKNTPRQTQWELLHQITIGSKVNYMSQKRE